MWLLMYHLCLEIIFMRAGTLSTLFTPVLFACQVEGSKYTYRMNGWINPSNDELQELLCSLLLLELGPLQTHVTVDTSLPLSCIWPALGATHLSGYLLSWLGCVLAARHRLVQTVWGEVWAARLYLAGRFDRTWRGPGSLYDMVPLQRGRVVQVSVIDNCLFYMDGL